MNFQTRCDGILCLNISCTGRRHDEALVIRGIVPDCGFTGVLLWNKYLHSFDCRLRQISLNKRQPHYDADGNFTIVVAQQNPGVANWLDTEGGERRIE